MPSARWASISASAAALPRPPTAGRSRQSSLSKLAAGFLRDLDESLGVLHRFIGDLHEQRAPSGTRAAGEAHQLVGRRGLGMQRLEVLAAAVVAVSADVTDANTHGASSNIRASRFRFSRAGQR